MKKKLTNKERRERKFSNHRVRQVLRREYIICISVTFQASGTGYLIRCKTDERWVFVILEP